MSRRSTNDMSSMDTLSAMDVSCGIQYNTTGQCMLEFIECGAIILHLLCRSTFNSKHLGSHQVLVLSARQAQYIGCAIQRIMWATEASLGNESSTISHKYTIVGGIPDGRGIWALLQHEARHWSVKTLCHRPNPRTGIC